MFQTMQGTAGPMSESIAIGEELRNDTRTHRALPPDGLRELTRLAPVRSTLSVPTTPVAAAASNRGAERCSDF